MLSVIAGFTHYRIIAVSKLHATDNHIALSFTHYRIIAVYKYDFSHRILIIFRFINFHQHLPN